MRAAGNALRSAGLRRFEVLQVARRHPPVLARDPTQLVYLVSFLRYHCGLNRGDLLPFLNRYPAVLGADVEDIEPKVEYLFQSLGGSQEMLRRFPAFLSFDLEAHTRPRAEFLRAMGIDPLMNGLAYLVTAPSKEIAELAGVRVELFNQFQTAYPELWKKKKPEDDSNDSNTSGDSREARAKNFVSKYIYIKASPEDDLLDEFDFSF
jgi:mTERF